jgi:predicted secreted protein
MLDPVLNLAILIIWWWISLFVMLPIGVRSIGEDGAGEVAGPPPGALGPGEAGVGRLQQAQAPSLGQGAGAYRGHDLGAPVAHNLKRKALWAGVAAVVLWAATAAFIYFDPFHVRPDLPR